MNNKALLTIYIPIYNRCKCLEKTLSRFLEDKDLFEQKVILIVSDNCSKDDIYGVCCKYMSYGLNIQYHRNETNIGGDKNILQGFQSADSRYLWILGSDDVPVSAFLRLLVGYLEENDFGILHLAGGNNKKDIETFNDNAFILEKIGVMITFISANIISTKQLSDVNIIQYGQTSFYQVPFFISALRSGSSNAILHYGFIDKDFQEYENNGGYNYYKVFVEDLLNVLRTSLEGWPDNIRVYERLKQIIFRNHIAPYTISFFVFNKIGNYKIEGAKDILLKYYARCWYAYIFLLRSLFRRIVGEIYRYIKGCISD